MPEPRKSSATAVVGIVLVLLLGVYVGAYYWMVRVVDSRFLVAGPRVVFPLYVGWPGLRAVSDSKVVRVFAPMHWLDRRLRPRVWNPR